MTTQPLSPLSSVSDPFAQVGGIDAKSLLSEVKLKLAIVGKPKTGKSWLAVTAPKPILVYDFDDRAQSLRGKDGIRIKTLVDLDQNNPNAMRTVENDLALLKSTKNAGESIPSTFVFDSVTYMKKSMENELIRQDSKLGRTIRLSPSKKLSIGAGWDIINGVRGYLEYIVNEFSQLGNVIFIFHERDEKDVDKSTSEKTAYTGRYTVDPQYLATVLCIFNECWRITIDYKNAYIVQTKPDNEFGASTTLEIDKEETPSIELILKKHHERISKKI